MVNTRKGPSNSATKFRLGTKKKGNDGNIWKIVQNKHGTKRWLKDSKTSKKHTKTSKKQRYRRIPYGTDVKKDIIWGKNKKLESFWGKLASGKQIVLVYTNGESKTLMMPKAQPAASNKYKELEQDNTIKAIITSAQSSESYEGLYKRVKQKTPEEVVNKYNKYLINYGDKIWYL